MDVDVRLADSPRLRLGAFRLRYQVYAVEMGDGRFADHDAGTYSDARDDSARTWVAVLNDGAIAATARVVLRRDGPYADENFQYPELERLTGLSGDELLDSTGVLSRGVVRSDLRASGAMHAIFVALCADARLLGLRVLLVASEPGNLESIRWLERQGFQRYGQDDELDGWTGTHLFLLL